MSLDALALVSRVIDRAAQKASQAMGPAATGLGEEQRIDLMVDTLASQVLGFIGLGPPAGPQEGGDASDLERLCAEQMARNQQLARALGACDCWGEMPSCPACGGRGAAGWQRPHKAPFDQFVSPVVRRVVQHRVRARRHAAAGAGPGYRTQ